MKLASLCSGYGGLDLAVQEVIGPLELAWFAEIEPRAANVFAVHHPGVPNLGDLTAIIDPPPVDILTGGFPCQPVSSAGARKGTVFRDIDGEERYEDRYVCGLCGAEVFGPGVVNRNGHSTLCPWRRARELFP